MIWLAFILILKASSTLPYVSVLQTVSCGESQSKLEPDRVQASEGGGCLADVTSRLDEPDKVIS